MTSELTKSWRLIAEQTLRQEVEKFNTAFRDWISGRLANAAAWWAFEEFIGAIAQTRIADESAAAIDGRHGTTLMEERDLMMVRAVYGQNAIEAIDDGDCPAADTPELQRRSQYRHERRILQKADAEFDQPFGIAGHLRLS